MSTHVRKNISSWSEKERWEKSAPADSALPERKPQGSHEEVSREGQINFLETGFGRGTAIAATSKKATGMRKPP